MAYMFSAPRARVAKAQALGGFFSSLVDVISDAADAVKNVVTGGGGGSVSKGLPTSIRPLQHRRTTAPSTSIRRY